MKKELSTFEMQLCDIQGRMFEIFLKNHIHTGWDMCTDTGIFILVKVADRFILRLTDH